MNIFYLDADPKIAADKISDDVFTDPPQCMPDQYKSDCTVSAYRDYYLGEKMDIAKWAHSESPTWVLSKATWSHVK